MDAKRRSGISSSAREHTNALLRTRQIRDFLTALGWPEPLMADSGNGGHLLYLIDLAADDGGLVKHVLETLALSFSDAVAEVDTSVFNPARICKLYGTVARKGDSTPERPHRLAHLKSVPEELQVVSRAQLEALAASAPQPPQPPRGRAGRDSAAPPANSPASFDLEMWIDAHQLPVQGPYDWPAGGPTAQKWVFDVCPFNAEHVNRSAVLLRGESGAIAFRCLHNSCREYGWRDLRDLYGDAGQRTTTPSGVPRGEGHASERSTTSSVPTAAPQTRGSALVASGIVVATIAPQPLRWLWPGRIPLGKITVLDGDPGLGKSLVSLDIAARITQEGTCFPDGAAAVSGGVVLLNVEDDAADTIRPRLEAAGADLERVLLLNERLVLDTTSEAWVAEPISLPSGFPELETAIGRRGAVLVVIDPLMAFLEGRVDSHRDQDVRRALAPLALLAQRTQAGVLIVRHLNKDNAGSAIYRGGGSIGIIGAARSGLIVAPDPDDETRRILAMTKSNLAAPVSSLVYRIEEVAPGVPQVVWCGVSPQTAKTLFDGPQRSEERSLVLDMLQQAAPNALSPKDVAQATGCSLASIQKLLQRMEKQGDVVRVERGAYRFVERPTVAPCPPVHVSTSSGATKPETLAELAEVVAECPAGQRTPGGQVDSGLAEEQEGYTTLHEADAAEGSASPALVEDTQQAGAATDVITDAAQLAAALETLLCAPETLLYLDTETTGKDPLTVHLVSLQLHQAGGPTYVIDWRRADPVTWLPELDRLLSQVPIVGHNLAFDVAVLLLAGITKLHVGFDTMLAEQVIRGKGWSVEARDLSLQKVAAEYGVALDKTEQTAFVGLTTGAVGWQVPFTAAQVAYMRADVACLPAVVHAQQAKLAQSGQTETFAREMAIVPALARMRVHGVLVDEAPWRAVLAEVAREQEAVAAEALAVLNPLYRGAREEAYTQALAARTAWQQDRDAMVQTARTVWTPGPGETWGAHRKTRLAEWDAEHPKPPMAKRPTDLNLNATAQVREALALCGIEVEKVDAGTLAPYAESEKAVAALLRYKVVSKLLSSFGERLLELRGADGRWHPEIHQIGADTGRMACSKPNVQQLPRRGEYGAQLRQAVVAPPDHHLVTADFSNIELRILAEMTGDPTMLALFAAGHDLHTETARRVFGLGPDVDVRKAELKPGLTYRDAAKTLNFATVYGASPPRIARQLGISIEEAEQFLEEYFSLFPEVRAWRSATQAAAVRDGFTTTLGGRRRYFEVPPAPVGWVPQEEYRAYRKAIGDVERAACNHPIQGTSADITKEAIRLFDERVRPDVGGLVLAVHDELVVECHQDQAEEVARALTGAMRDACARFLKTVVVPEPEAVPAPYWAKA